MPITRKQLIAASSSRRNNNNSKTNEPTPVRLVSDDDLFEQSANQVSSASRQTRTINHQIPVEMRKQLQGVFIAASNDENHNRGSNVNLKTVEMTQSLPPPRATLIKRSTIVPALSSAIKSARVNVFPNIRAAADENDSIFDVPLSSPSPTRRPPSNDNIILGLNTPVKAVNPKILALTTPIQLSKSSLSVRSPIVFAGTRKTPLTMAEKKRRQSPADVPDSLIEVDTFDFVESLKNEKPPLESVPVNQNRKIKTKTKDDNVINDSLSSDDEKVKSEEVVCQDLVDSSNIPNVSDNNATSNAENVPKRKVFIRNSATESAPPELNSTLIRTETSNQQSTPLSSMFTSTNFDHELSLVIGVPSPPKLDDLESLDPELYIKLKSGSIRDDPSTPLISESDRVDIENFLESFASPELAKSVIPVGIIGEGTFSTVYKVIDKTFYECENSGWIDYSRQNPLDWLRLWRWVYNNTECSRATDGFVLYRDGKRCIDRQGRSVNERKVSTGGGRLTVLLRRYLMEWAMRSLESLLPSANPSESILSSISPRALQSAMLRFRPHFIALKRINATSSPQRILDEISFLKYLGGKNNVVPVISGIRGEDQVLVTFPYFYSEDFREFLSSGSLSIKSIACYMRSLFISLAHLHHHNVIHRDVKPSNFLYAPENGGRAVLLDFGLAQKSTFPSSRTSTSFGGGNGQRLSTSAHQHRIHTTANASRNVEKDRKKLQTVNVILNTLGSGIGVSGDDPCDKMSQLILQLGPGYFNNDPRAGMKASRAGTRGFRAPEVLFKSSHQTTALDIWSAGVILLTLLTRRYPFFQSSDDFDAIVEIANIFGNEEMSTAAKLYNRRWLCNVPSVPDKHVTWPGLCTQLNPTFAPEIPTECFDLLRECMNLNSEKRITARTALKHDFIQKFAK